MNKQFAWMLGYLLSDGHLSYPTKEHPHKDIYASFICKYDDRDILYKVKQIFHSDAKVRLYPNYKSPQARLDIYGIKDFILKYKNIKNKIPFEDIKGYERHFVRGLYDGDGCLHYRSDRNTFLLNYINEHEHIVDFVQKIIIDHILYRYKPIKYISKDHIWKIVWEGIYPRLVAWWLYHGDISDCCLDRKLKKYQEYILDNRTFNNKDQEAIYASKAYIENNEIIFRVPSIKTLEWAHRLQKVLSFKTVPVYHNKGTKKYYRLYIPDKTIAANMRDIQVQIA